MSTTTATHTVSVHASKKRRKFCRCSCGWESPHRTTADDALIATVVQHPQAICPTPCKQRHKTRRDADLVLLEFWRSGNTGKKELRRTYECVCGFWHTTSRPN